MSNNKQNSVEWSIDQMIALCEDYDDGKIDYTDYINGVKEVKSQAKAMHNQEHLKTYNQLMMSNFQTFEHYYNETFKNK